VIELGSERSSPETEREGEESENEEDGAQSKGGIESDWAKEREELGKEMAWWEGYVSDDVMGMIAPVV